jgi:hypothetical protein
LDGRLFAASDGSEINSTDARAKARNLGMKSPQFNFAFLNEVIVFSRIL